MKKYSRAGALLMASILGASVAMTGCERVGSESVVEERNNDDKDRYDISDEIKEDISEAYATMGYQLLSEGLRDNDGSSNVMISPTSVAFALDMAAMGAEGDTYDNMADILSGGASKSEIDSYVRGYLASIEDDDALKIADSIWVNDGQKLNKDYASQMEDDFGAVVSVEDFGDSRTVNKINDWVNDKTDGMIENIISDENMQGNIILVNATCFDSKWKEKYEADDIDLNGVFTNGLGEEETAKMMSCKVNKYLSTDKATGFLKEYAGGRYVFMAILPTDDSISIAEFSQDFTADDFEELYKSKSKVEVHTTMPAFSFEYSDDLVGNLGAIGMDKPFSSDADFSGIIKDGDIYFDEVIHKTYIELDENGTKAAAATAVTTKNAVEVEEAVCLDRPFMFAIIDTEYDVPLFIGAVNTLK